MDSLRKEEVVQAVLIADNFTNNFQPISKDGNVSLLPLVNTPLIDYALEALNKSKVEEVFLFCTTSVEDIKEHINKRIKERCSWSINMSIHIVGSDGCYCLGDALRDLYAKQLIRGHFILLGTNTVTNANLHLILEAHKRQFTFDNKNAMTVVFKKKSPGIPVDDKVIIAVDSRTKRLLYHYRVPHHKHQRQITKCEIPLEIFTVNSEVEIRNDLIDPQIAICSPEVLSQFADNFDFATRDDFIRGLLINEEILESTIYFAELSSEQYAAQVRNWQMYQIVSNNIINRWVYPLVPDMGICCLKQNYIFLRNNVYRNKSVQLARCAKLRENVVVHENCNIGEGSKLGNTVIARNCKIGRKCELENTFIFEGVEVGENCTIRNAVLGKGTVVRKGCVIENGCVIGAECVIPEGKTINKQLITATDEEADEEFQYVKLGEQAFILEQNTALQTTAKDAADSDEEEEVDTWEDHYMANLNYKYESSVYSSDSDDAESNRLSPIPDDTNIFLTEVIDSLERGFKEKSNPEYLILEINSSRYAYNMSLSEVNFYVAKAMFNLYPIKECDGNVMSAFNQIYGHLSPVLKNYIRGPEAMNDCLKAIEESCHQNEMLRPKLASIIHFLYDKEMLTEQSILGWHEGLDESKYWLRTSLSSLINWLNESSEEDSSDDDD